MTHTDPAPLVTFDGVSLGYGEFTVLRDVDLRVMPGQVVAMMGGSGSGKTTLLRAVTGQLPAQAGRISVFGRDMAELRGESLRETRQRMGVLFQGGALFTDLNVFENVAFPLREHTRLDDALIRDLVLMKLNAVGLRGARDMKPAEISGGMARRVALARTMALDPDLIMYDEPFTGLDPISLGITANLIRKLNDALGATSIIVSHDVTETFAIADYIYFISEGRIGAEGTPEALRASNDPTVRQFIDAQPDGPVKFQYPAPSLADDFGMGARA